MTTIPGGTGAGSGFSVVRYHSLVVDESSLPACLRPIAWTAGSTHALERGLLPALHPSTDPASCGAAPPGVRPPSGLLMGIAHRDRPHYGVQFHPESIATKYGAALFRNFAELVALHRGRLPAPSPLVTPPGAVDLTDGEFLLTC